MARSDRRRNRRRRRAEITRARPPRSSRPRALFLTYSWFCAGKLSFVQFTAPKLASCFNIRGTEIFLPARAQAQDMPSTISSLSRKRQSQLAGSKASVSHVYTTARSYDASEIKRQSSKEVHGDGTVGCQSRAFVSAAAPRWRTGKFTVERACRKLVRLPDLVEESPPPRVLKVRRRDSVTKSPMRMKYHDDGEKPSLAARQ